MKQYGTRGKPTPSPSTEKESAFTQDKERTKEPREYVLRSNLMMGNKTVGPSLGGG